MKKQKAEVDYSPGHKTSHCGKISQFDTSYCQHFDGPTRIRGILYGSCTKVTGPIRPSMWCKLYEKVSP